MSFLRNGKGKEKDLLSKKAHFYVEFLGWMETNGLRGIKYTEPVIRELRRRQKRVDTPPKLTIQVSKKELKISQDIEEKKKRQIKKIKFPTIPAQDVTFAVQSRRSHDGQLDDIVACIFLGYMPRTRRYVHVHVYRFDEPQTATTFVCMLNQIIDRHEHRIREVERELAAKGEIEMIEFDNSRLGSSDGMNEELFTGDSTADSATSTSSFSDDSLTFGNSDIDPDLQSLSEVQAFDSVTDELRQRLNIGKDSAPILLPPTDYDTISRARGNFTKHYEERRSHQLGIAGNPVMDSYHKAAEENRDDKIYPAEENRDDKIYPAEENAFTTNYPREFVYPVPDSHIPENKWRSYSPPVVRKPNDFENTPPLSRKPHSFHSSIYNPRQEAYFRHGRQDSQVSDHSGSSIRSQEDERGVVFQRGDDKLHEKDYYDAPETKVEMRSHDPRRYDIRRENLGKSLPADVLRREFASAGPRVMSAGYDVYGVGRSHDDIRYSDGSDSRRSGCSSPRIGSADFRVKRVNSLLR